MPHPLTGDFEAVLQVSGSTINRLLATMHQNAGINPTLPSFPHSAIFRIGDKGAIDRVRGTVRVQISVPRVELIHGATDRFLLEVGVRARYKADAKSRPLPQYIHGTVRAEYRIRDIDPNCFGWTRIASQYLWVRVVKESVKFTGTGFDEWNPAEIVSVPVDEQAIQDRITKQIATLLATRFEATPHPVSERFRRGLMRSLSPSEGGSAVVLPLRLNDEPAGDISSVNNLLLEGSDFAVAVRLEYLMSQIEPFLAKIRGLRRSFSGYTARITAATVRWEPHGWYGVVHISAVGDAVTSSLLPDFYFKVNEMLGVTFDSSAEVLRIQHLDRRVSVRSSDNLLATQAMTTAVWAQIHKFVQAEVDAVSASVQPSFGAAKEELASQLRTLDEQAGVWFEQADFRADGMILRGSITLTPRRWPPVQFDKTAQDDGYSALLTWIPGGRIDAFTWSWSWFGSGQPGLATHDDRFVLRRPRGKRSPWGGIDLGLEGTTPLPGLDGMGIMCLKIKGVRVDSTTGEFVKLETSRQCMRFGFPIRITPHEKSPGLFLRIWAVKRDGARAAPFSEVGLLEVGSGHGAEGRSANTLVVYAGETWKREIASTLREGLAGSHREDAGLSVLVLFRDGVLANDRGELAAEVEALAGKIGASVMVNEDVAGGWSAALALSKRKGTVGWRLINPGGGVTWLHDGRLEAGALASVLDEYLIPSQSPALEPISSPLKIGLQLSSNALHPGYFEPDDAERPCPPLPAGRVGLLAGSMISFVQRGSAASHAQLQQLSARSEGDTRKEPLVLAVVGGADEREVEVLKNELGFDLPMLPDPDGTIARRFGVRLWPTTVTLDQTGTVAAVQFGLGHPEHDAEKPEPKEEQGQPYGCEEEAS